MFLLEVYRQQKPRKNQVKSTSRRVRARKRRRVRFVRQRGTNVERLLSPLPSPSSQRCRCVVFCVLHICITSASSAFSPAVHSVVFKTFSFVGLSSLRLLCLYLRVFPVILDGILVRSQFCISLSLIPWTVLCFSFVTCFWISVFWMYRYVHSVIELSSLFFLFAFRLLPKNLQTNKTRCPINELGPGLTGEEEKPLPTEIKSVLVKDEEHVYH